jgi:hypothetical protein
VIFFGGDTFIAWCHSRKLIAKKEKKRKKINDLYKKKYGDVACKMVVSFKSANSESAI